MFLRRLSGPGKGITSSPVWCHAVLIRQIHSVPASCLLNICSARCCDVFFTRSSSAVLNSGFITVPQVSPVISSLRRIPIGTCIIYNFPFTLFLYSRIGEEKTGSRKYRCPWSCYRENSFPGLLKRRCNFNRICRIIKTICFLLLSVARFRACGKPAMRLETDLQERAGEELRNTGAGILSAGKPARRPSASAMDSFRGFRPGWSAFPSMGTVFM
jgi:hypothetical protein